MAACLVKDPQRPSHGGRRQPLSDAFTHSLEFPPPLHPSNPTSELLVWYLVDGGVLQRAKNNKTTTVIQSVLPLVGRCNPSLSECRFVGSSRFVVAAGRDLGPNESHGSSRPPYS